MLRKLNAVSNYLRNAISGVGEALTFNLQSERLSIEIESTLRSLLERNGDQVANIYRLLQTLNSPIHPNTIYKLNDNDYMFRGSIRTTRMENSLELSGALADRIELGESTFNSALLFQMRNLRNGQAANLIFAFDEKPEYYSFDKLGCSLIMNKGNLMHPELLGQASLGNYLCKVMEMIEMPELQNQDIPHK